MASGLSKRCIGALWNQPSTSLTLGRSQIWAKPDVHAVNSRRYATPAVKHKPKAPINAKGTSAPIASKLAPKPKVSAKSTSTTIHPTPPAKGAPERKNDSASSKPVSQVPSRKQPPPPTTASLPEKSGTKFHRAAGGMAYKIADKKEIAELTEEEQIAQVDRIMAMSKFFPTADPWGQRVETLGGSFRFSILPLPCTPPYISREEMHIPNCYSTFQGGV